MTYSALILAGTRPGGDPLAGTEGKPHKALIELEGTALLERVSAALREAGADRIAVSCDHPDVVALARSLDLEVLPTGQGPSESTAIAFAELGAPLLVTTADHGLLKPEWVSHIVETTPQVADLSIMLAERRDIEAAMPGSKRTYLRLADGAWSGCNLFYLQHEGAGRAIENWKAVEADRKRPWRIVRRLGVSTLVKYALGRLSMAQAIEMLGLRMGVRASLVKAPDGLAAVDVDKPQDLNDIRELLHEGRA